MSGLFVWFPPLGSAAFIALAVLVQKVDLQQQRLEVIDNRKVLPRAWSQASANAHQLGYWLMCLAAIVLSTTLSATTLWQYQASQDILLLDFGLIASLAIFMMAIVPTSSNKLFINIYHLAMAGLFLAMSAGYTFKAALLETYTSQVLFVVRLIASGLIFAALAYMLFGGLYLYYTAATSLEQQKRVAVAENSEFMTEEEELHARKMLFLLAIAQGSAGIGLALSITTGAAETWTLSLNDSGFGAVVGVSVLVVTLLITGLAYKYK